MISANFKTARGVITDRMFERSEGVSIYGKSGISFQTVRLTLVADSGIGIHFSTVGSDWRGDYNFYLVLPDKAGHYQVWVENIGLAFGENKIVTQIGVGTLPPDPNGPGDFVGPIPPEEEDNTWLYVVAALLVIVGLYYAFK